jgi:hypothetical protein
VGTGTGGTAGFGVPTPGTFEGVVQRNVITTPDPVQSYSGINVDLRPQAGSASHVRVYDNLVNGVGGCNCGGAAGVRITSLDPGTSRVDAWHNTVVRTARGGAGPASGIDVYQYGGSSLRVNMFDNIAALGRGPGISIGGADSPPKLASGWNDTFGNSQPNQWDGLPHPHHLAMAPGFVDAKAGNFRLSAGSPLVDSGTVCQPGALGLLDVTRGRRLVGVAVDIGAYERGSRLARAGGVLLGGGAPDTLVGTSRQDFLCGFGGADDISGRGGNDFLGGGGGNDRLTGGLGKDVAYGNRGADTIRMKDSSGGDTAKGGPGSDTCATDPGDTRVSC